MTSHSRRSQLTATFSNFRNERSLVGWAVYFRSWALVPTQISWPSFFPLMRLFCGAGFFLASVLVATFFVSGCPALRILFLDLFYVS